MKTINIKLVLASCMLLIFSACEDFLEEPLSKTSSLVIESTEHLDNLLSNYSEFVDETNNTFILSSDDFGLTKDIFDQSPGTFSYNRVIHTLWDTDNIPNSEDPYWQGEWKKIFTANTILQNVDDVSGNDADKQRIKAEAHFVRLYSYFNLVNTYCLPYANANMDELGLPVKTTTSFEESAKRASLKETWEFMAADLQEALALNVELKEVNGKKRTWRASNVAVKAFAARFYLAQNDYANALKYAEEALTKYSALVDYNTEMSFDPNVEPFETGDVVYPITRLGQSSPDILFQWKEFIYFRTLYDPSWWFMPSQDLLNTYDQDYDLRYKYHIVENYSFNRGMHPFSYPGYIFFFDKIPSGPTVAEMLLIKAECQARTGNWNEGLSTVNQLRVVRMDNTAPAESINLSAGSQAEAVTKILQERRREMPYSARWFDLRRFNNNDDPADDVVISKSFYPYNAAAVLIGDSPVTYTLEKNSRRYAAPIPETEVINTQGEFEQNRY